MLHRFIRFSSKQVDPKVKADELLNKLPSNNWIRNTTSLTLLASASAFALSKELYVFNEESILMASFATCVALVYKQGKPAFLETADAYIANMKKVLTDARAQHSKLVSAQVEESSKLSDITSETKNLFKLSKELIALEKEEYELKQRIELTTQVKQKLEAWNRFEQSQKESEKQRMLNTVLGRINSELAKKETQQQLFAQALRDLDSVKAK